MSITPRRVHDEHTRVFPDGLRECFRTMLHNDVAPADFAWLGGIKRNITVRVLSALERRDDYFRFEARFSLITNLDVVGT